MRLVLGHDPCRVAALTGFLAAPRRLSFQVVLLERGFMWTGPRVPVVSVEVAGRYLSTGPHRPDDVVAGYELRQDGGGGGYVHDSAQYEVSHVYVLGWNGEAPSEVAIAAAFPEIPGFEGRVTIEVGAAGS